MFAKIKYHSRISYFSLMLSSNGRILFKKKEIKEGQLDVDSILE
jgi:hypothetical protein